MLKNIRQFGVVGVAVTILFVLVLTMSHADAQRYHVRPEIRQEITLPEHRTDAARAIDAYERTMDRFMALTENNLATMNLEVKLILAKVASINTKVNELSTRMARIEEALGIKTVSSVVPVEDDGADKSENKPNTRAPEGRK